MEVRWWVLLGIFLLLLLTGRFLLFFGNLPVFQKGQQVSFTTTLLSDPTISKGYTHMTVYTRGVPFHLLLPLDAEFSYGDTIHISGTVSQISVFSGRASYLLFEPAVKKTDGGLGGLRFLASLRKTITQDFHHYLPQTAAALLLGIVFGIKEQMPASFQTQLANAGVIHVIAASGMNVTIIAGVLVGLFSRLFRRQHAVALALLGIWLYACFAGLQASILRASIMGSLALLAQLTGRQYMGLLGLGMAGYVMILLSPLVLFDVGFTYSLLSVVVNVLVLWTVPPLMLLGGLAAIFALLPVVSSIFLYLSLPLIWYFTFVVQLCSRFGV